MMETGVELGASALIWFAVYAVRSWLPGRAVAWLDGPQRVWPLVLVAALGVTALEGSAGSAAEYVLTALQMAVAAVGIDQVRRMARPRETEA